MLAQRRAHGALAGLLARAVNPERIDRIVLPIGAALGAVEDIIGRDMDQRNAGIRGTPPRYGAGPSQLAAQAASGSVSARSTAV